MKIKTMKMKRMIIKDKVLMMKMMTVRRYNNLSVKAKMIKNKANIIPIKIPCKRMRNWIISLMQMKWNNKRKMIDRRNKSS